MSWPEHFLVSLAAVTAVGHVTECLGTGPKGACSTVLQTQIIFLAQLNLQSFRLQNHVTSKPTYPAFSKGRKYSKSSHLYCLYTMFLVNTTYQVL